MTRTIWEYDLKPTGVTALEMPAGAVALSVANQGDQPQLWALVDPDAPKVRRRFASVVTGGLAPDGSRFLGTVLLYCGTFVLHVFEEPTP